MVENNSIADAEFQIGRDLLRRLQYSVEMLRALASTYENEDGTIRNDEKFNQLHLQADDLHHFTLTSREELLLATTTEELNKVLEYWTNSPFRMNLSEEAEKHLTSYIKDYENSFTLDYFRNLHNERVRNEK